MSEECKVEYSTLTLEVTGARKELESLLDIIADTKKISEFVKLGKFQFDNFEITDFCPEHGNIDDLHQSYPE